MRQNGRSSGRSPLWIIAGTRNDWTDVLNDKLQEKIVDYIEDAHAMEQNVLRMLDTMISTTDDPQIEETLRRHKQETERHEQSLRERLDALGTGSSTRKEVQAIATALMKGAADKVRGDQAGKNARDGFITEHMEIVSSQVLERLAERAGDRETAEVVRRNRADEEAMAQEIDSNWDRCHHLERGASHRCTPLRYSLSDEESG